MSGVSNVVCRRNEHRKCAADCATDRQVYRGADSDGPRACQALAAEARFATGKGLRHSGLRYGIRARKHGTRYMVLDALPGRVHGWTACGKVEGRPLQC